MNERVFNGPTVTCRKGNTNARWVLCAKQQHGRGRFRGENGTTVFIINMVPEKMEKSPQAEAEL